MISRRDLPHIGIVFLFLLSVLFLFTQPKLVSDAIRQSLTLCTGPLLTSLFPFLILSNLLFVCNTHLCLGRFFCLPAKLVGIHNPSAGSPLLMGYTGGFAPAAVTLRNLYKSRTLSAQECTALLPICLCPSPAFVVVTVGDFFHNRQLGWILYFSQIFACLGCGLVYRLFHHIDQTASIGSPSPAANAAAPSFPDAISNATLTYGKLCGCILFFGFLSACLSHYLPQPFCSLVSFSMEITSGCLYAAQIAPHGIYLCCCAISLLGISAWIQLRALLPKEISLKPFLLLRPLHMAFSMGFLWVMLRCLPVADVYNSLAPAILLRHRTSPLYGILLFFLLCRLAALLSKLPDWKKSHSMV